jgi:hypothetical protein
VRLGAPCAYRCNQCDTVGQGYTLALPAGWVSQEFSYRLRWEPPQNITKHFCSQDCATTHVKPGGYRPDWLK